MLALLNMQNNQIKGGTLIERDVSTRLPMNTIGYVGQLAILGKTTARATTTKLHEQPCFCSISHQYSWKSTKPTNFLGKQG